ncbi:hypothetical protein FACS1894205_4810 [Alphaproteobacteria bacterium]|nr:hypothetical protein FACS1894205_4810 [Alphaproteobacteria bacterium]
MGKVMARVLGALIWDKKKRHKVRDVLLDKEAKSNSPVSIRSNELEFVDTRTGKYYLPRDAKGDIIANSIRNNCIFDEEIYNLAKQFIREDTIALDVGSNFGQMAILMSKCVGETGKVHAFEAQPFVFEILQKNIDCNKARVIPHGGAVHNIGGEKLFFPEPDMIAHQTYGSYGIDYAHGAQGRGTLIPTIAIDDIDFDLPISFMKIDVQGGDLLAMSGARKTIERHRMPIIFEYEYLFELDQNLCFQDYVDFVRSINYRFSRCIYGHNFLILPNESRQDV